jgi:hypothetical protein
MDNKKLLIGVGVAVVVYYFYNKKQKEKLQATPYTDAELNKVVTDFIAQERKRALEINPNSNPIEIEKGKKEIFEIIHRGKLNNKDVSRANVDRILGILRKITRNQMGDNSMGIATPEEQNEFDSFIGIKRPVEPIEPTKPSSPIGEKRDFANGISVVYDIANCNKMTYKCPIMRVIKREGDSFTSWYSEKNKYFKRIENPSAPKGGNVTEITEKQYIDEAMSKIPF